MKPKYREFYGKIEQSIDFGDEITTYICDDGRVCIECRDRNGVCDECREKGDE